MSVVFFRASGRAKATCAKQVSRRSTAKIGSFGEFCSTLFALLCEQLSTWVGQNINFKRLLVWFGNNSFELKFELPLENAAKQAAQPQSAIEPNTVLNLNRFRAPKNDPKSAIIQSNI